MITVTGTTLCELVVIRDGIALPDLSISVGEAISLDVNVNAVGPRGPAGPQGPQGEVFTPSIGQLSDVMLTNVQNGDLLIYQSSKFINSNQTNLTDGGNF